MLRRLIRVFLAAALFVLAARSTVFALDRKESYALSHYIMAIVYDDLGDVDRAIKEYKKVLRVDDKSSRVHLNLASSLIKKNDLTGAVRELKIVEKLNPEAVESHVILAIIYSIQNKPDLASSEYEIALKNASKLDPKDIDIYKNLGALYLRQNKLKEAKDIYQKISALSPDDPKVHFILGNIYNELGQSALSEKEVKRSLELDPEYPDALNFLGYEYLEQNKELKKARDMIKKAIALDPDNGAYIDSLGWYYYKEGKFDEARKFLEQAVSLMEDAVIYDHLGDTYLKLRNLGKARESWEKSIKLNADNKSVKEKIEAVNKNVSTKKSN